MCAFDCGKRFQQTSRRAVLNVLIALNSSFQHFCIFVSVCPVMLFDSPATLDNDSGVVYDSDYNDYSVVLRDK